MKTNMNKVAVMAAVVMAMVGYVAGKANTPTTIEPRPIVVAHAAIEEEETVEPETIEEEVEDKKEDFVKIEKVLNSNGTQKEFRVYTKGEYDNTMTVVAYDYLPEAIEYINEYTDATVGYYERNDKFVVVDIANNKAIDVEVMRIVE